MNYLDDSIDLLRQMVRVPSVSFEEGDVRDLISARLSEWKVPHTLLRGNIVAASEGFDPSRPTLSLDAHIDTVPPCAGYSFDPFDPGTDP
ncbi:MAG: hypothetical protein IJP93_01255, partial [Bacteroidales bacterium]|nr:hypothetical protein [Bacteroidales bacterium]